MRGRLIIAILLLCACAVAGETVTEKPEGESLVSIKSGTDPKDTISYGLFFAVDSHTYPGRDLVLVVRNIGAKFLDMKNVTVDDFRLRDSQGKDIKIYLRSAPLGMAIGHLAIAHINVATPDAPQPWTLQFKSKPKSFVPLELTISDIATAKK